MDKLIDRLSTVERELYSLNLEKQLIEEAIRCEGDLYKFYSSVDLNAIDSTKWLREYYSVNMKDGTYERYTDVH